MDPQISAFALGLLLGAAKIGFIGTVGFGIGWWRTARKLRRRQGADISPENLDERLAHLERLGEHTANQIDRVVEQQSALTDAFASFADRQRLTPPK